MDRLIQSAPASRLQQMRQVTSTIGTTHGPAEAVVDWHFMMGLDDLGTDLCISGETEEGPSLT
jgi:hypothetical protein